MGAALSTGGLISTRGLASDELAIWVVLFMDTGPRGTRADRLRGSPTTTLTPPLGPTTEVKRHSARRQQFDHWTQYVKKVFEWTLSPTKCPVPRTITVH